MKTPTINLATMGTLSVLLGVQTGAPVVAFGNVPPAMVGAKWADVHSWRVFFWHGGEIFVCRHELKSEDGRPWELGSVARHFDEYRDHWKSI